ncbi:MAG: hypothetical protein N2201_05965 [candidate division WOR-3 bacterium]|nr:hypothetical protein [candidate division WOR-3 bacterium]
MRYNQIFGEIGNMVFYEYNKKAGREKDTMTIAFRFSAIFSDGLLDFLGSLI